MGTQETKGETQPPNPNDYGFLTALCCTCVAVVSPMMLCAGNAIVSLVMACLGLGVCLREIASGKKWSGYFFMAVIDALIVAMWVVAMVRG